jgi:GMP synthase-like glutamine amidotransferase
LTWALLQHVPHEGPGLIASAAAEAGVDLVPSRAWASDTVPDAAEIDGVVAMGGPMSVNDVGEHAWLEPEIELLRRALDRELPVLGVCLGAQLLARAVGCEVRASEREEIGAGTVELTEAARDDPLLGRCGERIEAFHWHGETFDLPAGATTLASTALCANQAFRAGERAWALQFHLEVDARLAAAWRPLLPASTELGEGLVRELEREGAPVVRRFFELSAGK